MPNKKSKKILVVDNYDSFVYVLVQYLGSLGAKLEVFRNDMPDFIDKAEALKPDAVLVSPGPGRPSGAGVSVQVIKHFSGKLPILGVCLGHQCIAEAFGGKVVRDTHVTHGKTSAISHNEAGLYLDLPNPLTATRYHSLLVAPESLPSELEITASTQGKRIMGIRHTSHPTEGIQFHPESVMTDRGMQLLENFLDF